MKIYLLLLHFNFMNIWEMLEFLMKKVMLQYMITINAWTYIGLLNFWWRRLCCNIWLPSMLELI